ncbi:hydroxyacid dehydrogenase [Sporomusa acidovorans]|uniref:D-3-phosphoglycerate dehydrogenase n=1 Tax=Sporomusa acidovorans (strain ATCC 49682 / DSM 3132 / Mol) TaxID=1123286 RepID=A0ABZ3J607_SPOA4|nr:hydroxyacid dehydrogenase [Sporomusa acidovorans]OZC15698.1 D-3-phosphoglycerate dehydrogenase [Sporomusa acidovorans DSM 3132]SDE89311.1 D-3-phosphoglycerate dehydrogenase [Sporomusa acidovorans]
MKKVVISHRLHDDGMAVLEKAKVNIAITNNGDPKAMLPELLDAEGLIIRIGAIDRETMLAAKNLKVIGRPGVGVDDVDVDTATELGIPVVIAPGANTRSVAEHAFAFMFAAAKDMIHTDKELRKGNFSIRSSYKAFEIYGKTLGLVGYGNIGSVLAQMAASVGMKVVVYDPYIKPEAISGVGYQYESDLERLLQLADVVSLHVPLTAKTKNLIGADELKLMKKNAILINCARGGIVDETALAKALENNELHAAATDVFGTEPVTAGEPLLTYENIIVSPHMAGQTKEAASAVATMAAEGVIAVINGQRWQHVCNPKAYEHPRWN